MPRCGAGGRGHPGQRRVREGLGPRLRRDLSDLLHLHPGHRRRRRRSGEPARGGRSVRVRAWSTSPPPTTEAPRSCTSIGREARSEEVGGPVVLAIRRASRSARTRTTTSPTPTTAASSPRPSRAGHGAARRSAGAWSARRRACPRAPGPTRSRMARPALPHLAPDAVSVVAETSLPTSGTLQSAPRTPDGATPASLAGRLHEFRPDRLEPDSKYFYRVLCAADAPRPDQLDLASEVRSFRTAPNPTRASSHDLHRRRRHPGQRRGGRPRLGAGPRAPSRLRRALRRSGEHGRHEDGLDGDLFRPYRRSSTRLRSPCSQPRAGRAPLLRVHVASGAGALVLPALRPRRVLHARRQPLPRRAVEQLRWLESA